MPFLTGASRDRYTPLTKSPHAQELPSNGLASKEAPKEDAQAQVPQDAEEVSTAQQVAS
jgi:hypothetical protein